MTEMSLVTVDTLMTEMSLMTLDTSMAVRNHKFVLQLQDLWIEGNESNKKGGRIIFILKYK